MLRCQRSRIVSFLLLWTSAGVAHAQSAPDSALTALTEAFVRGSKAFDAERYEDALRHFQLVAATQRAYATAEKGSALYWLGRTHEQLGNHAEARATWWATLRLFDGAGLFEAALADAYVRSAYRHGDTTAYERAATVYLALLDHLGRTSNPDNEALLERHVAQMAFLLPEELGAARPDTAYGQALSAWWRSQDPLPATLRNERLEEHLARVAHAEAHFGDESRPAGFDDRGVIYARLGEPYRKRDLFVKDPALVRQLSRLGVRETASDVPESTAWFYQDLDYYAYYLFAESDDGHYRLAETTDLIPRSLRSDLTRTQRGMTRSEASIRLMRQIYQELSLFHPDFASRYSDVDSYAGMMDEAKLASQATAFMQQTLNRATEDRPQEDAGGEFAPNPTTSVPEGLTLDDLSLPKPNEFAATALLSARAADHAARSRREEVVPRQHTSVHDKVPSLPVAVRSARFLKEDGSTRTEVYWTPAPGALASPDETQQAGEADFFLRLTAAQKTADYANRRLSQNRYVFEDPAATTDGTLPPQTLELSGDTATYHVGLQWDLYRLDLSAETGSQPVGEPVQRGTYRLDSLSALNDDEGVLEMSDLVPVVAYEGEDLLADDLYRRRPYPFRHIAPDVKLGFYFEIYHLNYADEETRYTVAYEVNTKRKRGLLKRLFGGERDDRTGARTTYTGNARKAEEFILIDLSEWRQRDGELEITVRVTDETTGAEVARSIEFDLAP